MSRTGRTIRRGFTLVEAIAALTIIAVLGSVSSRIVYSAISSVRDGSDRAQLHAEGCAAMETLLSALRDVSRTAAGGGNITSVTASSITYNTTQTVALSGTTLNFTDTAQSGTAQPMLRNVSSFAIQCYDQDGTALATSLSGSGIDPVRRVQITITLSKNGLSETIRSRVFLRNTMQGAG